MRDTLVSDRLNGQTVTTGRGLRACLCVGGDFATEAFLFLIGNLLALGGSV